MRLSFLSLSTPYSPSPYPPHRSTLPFPFPPCKHLFPPNCRLTTRRSSGGIGGIVNEAFRAHDGGNYLSTPTASKCLLGLFSPPLLVPKTSFYQFTSFITPFFSRFACLWLPLVFILEINPRLPRQAGRVITQS